MKSKSLDALSGAFAAMLVAAAACAAMSASSSALAQAQAQAPASGASRTSGFGDATQAWLELQRSNQAAAPALPILGAQASLAYERYLNSFKTKIPDTLSSAIAGHGRASPASAY